MCVAAAAAFLSSHDVAAQQAPPCGPRDKIVEHLAKEYGEHQAAVALADNGSLVEVFASEGGASFTLLVSSPDGKTSCFAATGQSWRFVFTKPAGPQT